MLGVVFTEFIEMVESKFSFDIADQIISETGVGSEIGFTSVDYYDHKDLVKLIVSLSKITNSDIDQLIRAFGEHLFDRFFALYPILFNNSSDTFSFLEGVENYIHNEVRKLYPNAELPKFECVRFGTSKLQMRYTSTRPFSELAHGLILGCARHFNEQVKVDKLENGPDGSVVFLLVLQGE